MVKKFPDKYCVVHAHEQKPDVPQDKPVGTPIKCFPYEQGNEKSEETARRKAYGLHHKIVTEQKKTNKK